MEKYYILNGHKAVPVGFLTWSEWYGNTMNRHVADEKVGKVRISTIFLGVDHSWTGPPPLLFETMVFGGLFDMEMDRYATWKEAERGHKIMVEKVKTGKKEDQ